MTEAHILCYGEIDLDFYLAVNRFPGVDTYASVQHEFTNVGGGAGNTAVWLANWGLPVRLTGNTLGNDANGKKVRQQLAAYPTLDTQYIHYRDNHATLVCQCLVRPDGERTFIMHTPKDMEITTLTEAMLDDVQLLSLDMSGALAPRLAAAQVAHRLNVPILVNDVYTLDHPLAALADVIVISAAVVRAKLPQQSVESIAHDMRTRYQCSVIITDGVHPAKAYWSNGNDYVVNPPQIDVVDTTGAGDIFKAGLLYGLIKQFSPEETLKFAVAAGTIKAGRAGTTHQPATIDEVEQLAHHVNLA